MNTSNIPDYLKKMPIKDFLEILDDFGDGHIHIHEASRRLKEIINNARKLIDFHYASETSPPDAWQAWEFISKLAGKFELMCDDYLDSKGE